MTPFTFEGAGTILIGERIESPSQELIKNTLSLWQADLDTALKYGGELTRSALGAMDIRGDKRYVLVDTKVHLLMPGQCPAIPGWHTDGVPREAARTVFGQDFHPVAGGAPSMNAQRLFEEAGDTPRFHLLVTGKGCLTDFLAVPVTLDVEHDSSPHLYKGITEQITKLRPPKWEMPSCTAIQWGWWHLHAAKLATEREFRFLIRVTESDYHEPLPPSRLGEIIRTQQMVYSPLEFGW